MPELLDRYIDGSMSGQERAEFEARLSSSASLREEIELQQRMDRALRDRFGAPAGAEAPLRLAGGPPRVSGSGSGFGSGFGFGFGPRVRWGLAALVALAATLVISFQYLGAGSGGGLDRRTLAQTYQNTVRAGFRPQEVCTTRDKFAKWMEDRYGAPLAPTHERPGAKLVGWSYGNAISGYTGLLLATVDEKPVVVVLDRKVKQSASGAPVSGELGNLRVFPREIAGVVLYEVTPLDHPAIVDDLALKSP
jgi:hypothetical protein